MRVTQPEFAGFPTSTKVQDEPIPQKLRRLYSEKGPLIPVAWMADILGVSRVRCYQLVDAGWFETVEVNGAKMVPVDAVEAFKELDRPGGRPRKAA